MSAKVLQEIATWTKESMVEFIAYLQFPNHREWWEAAVVCNRDLSVALGSTGTFLTLTFRPFLRLLWLLFGWLWIVIKFLARHLLSGVYHSTVKGGQQLWIASKAAYSWQVRQPRSVVFMELGVVATAVILYLLRRHIQKQKYYERIRRWYYGKQRAILKSYHRMLDKLNQTSKVLAMALPHAMFVVCAVAARAFLGPVISYFANETFAIWILKVGYPLLWTISLLHHHRHPASRNRGEQPPVQQQHPIKAAERVPPKEAFQSSKQLANGNKRTTTTKKRPVSFKTPSSSSRPPLKNTGSAKAGKKKKSVEKWIRAAAQSVTPHGKGQQNGGLDYDIDRETSYWWHYWITLAALKSVACMIYWTPIMGRLLSRNFWIASALQEVQLLGLIWLLLMPSSLTNEGSADPTKPYESRPIPLIYDKLIPLAEKVYKAVSEAIPESAWETVCDKAKSLLQLAVMVRLIKEARSASLHETLRHSRTMLPPAITLFLPGFLTSYGVLYVSSISPAAQHSSSTVKSTKVRAEHLEFWAIWVLLGGFLEWWSPVLWWIPFSTHAIFCLWCHVGLNGTWRGYYNMFEEELQAFGLLTSPSGPTKDVESTMTIRVWRAVISSLPSGVDDSEEDSTGKKKPNDGDDDDNDEGDDDDDRLSTDGDKEDSPETEADDDAKYAQPVQADETEENHMDIDPLDGDDPAEIDPVDEDDPAEIDPVDDDDPAEIDPVDEDYRAEIDPVDEDDPAEIDPVDEDDPAEIDPVDEDDPAEIGEDEPAKSNNNQKDRVAKVVDDGPTMDDSDSAKGSASASVENPLSDESEERENEDPAVEGSPSRQPRKPRSSLYAPTTASEARRLQRPRRSTAKYGAS